jgi:hypothetical protein
MTTKLLSKVFMSLLVATLLLGFPLGIWLTVRSTDYLRVVGYTYDGADITIERNMIQGDAMVRSYVTVIGADGRSCFERVERVMEAFDMNGAPITRETFAAPASLKPCLDSHPYTVVGRYYVRTFGGLMLLKPAFYFEPPRG